MKILGLCFLITGLSASCGLGWLLHRAVYYGELYGSRSLSDRWLVHWERQLDAAHPVSSGGLKLHGEWWRIQSWLFGWLSLAVTVAVAGLVCLRIWYRRLHHAYPFSAANAG